MFFWVLFWYFFGSKFFSGFVLVIQVMSKGQTYKTQSIVIPVTIWLLVNHFKPIIILASGGRRRPGLYADIPVPVLQVPVGEEGGTGGLPNLL